MITHKTSWLLAGLLCLALWPASAFAQIEPSRAGHSDAGAERFKQVLDELARIGPNRAGLSKALRSLPDQPRFTKIGEMPITFQFSDGSLSSTTFIHREWLGITGRGSSMSRPKRSS